MPVPPEEMVTKTYSNNKIYESIGAGEINLLKNIGLRNITMTILLPNDTSSSLIQSKYSPNCIMGTPSVYLNKFREFKENKKAFQLLITRELPDGKEIFKGNILVSLEDYTVYEKAGEEGDFWVLLNFKEYRQVKTKEISILDKTKGEYSENIIRTTKETPKIYTVKKGDTIWKIAKRELNNEILYKKIIELNKISNPKNLKIGQILKMP